MNYTNTDGNLLVSKIVSHTVVGLVGLIILFGSFRVVGAGERGVRVQLGNVKGVVDSGLVFKIPLIQTIKKINVQTQKEQVEASSASSDLQTVHTVVALNYHLDPDAVGKLYQEIGGDYKSKVIDPRIQDVVKATTAKHTAEQLITKREQVKDETTQLLREQLLESHIIVESVAFVNFDFSKSFNDAIEAKVTAEQSALSAKNKLEQVKYEAEQRITQAKGEAEAIRIQAQAIQSQGGAEYVNLKAVEKWNGTLPTYMMSGGSVPFINIK